MPKLDKAITSKPQPKAEPQVSVKWNPGYARKTNTYTGQEERGNCLGMRVRCANVATNVTRDFDVSPNKTAIFDLVGDALVVEKGSSSAGWRIIDASPLTTTMAIEGRKAQRDGKPLYPVQ